MGLDVLSVRCHRHNQSHSAAAGCPLCTREADDERARAAELEHEPKRRAELAAGLAIQRAHEQVEREHAESVELCKGCAAAGQLPPVLQLPPGAELAELGRHERPEYVQRALELAIERLPPAELVRMLSDTMLWQSARRNGTKLHRFELHGTCIGAGCPTTLQVLPPMPARLVRIDLSADEGERALELVRVGRVQVGTRTIGEGGTLAQLNRCPLAREVLVPSVGVVLHVENLSASRVTVRGVVLCEVIDQLVRGVGRVLGTARPAYGDELEPWEIERFERP